MSEKKTLVAYSKENAEEQYKEGYRFVYCVQYGPSYVYKEKPGAAWGSGVFELNEDGTIGKCVDWNFDSSD